MIENAADLGMTPPGDAFDPTLLSHELDGRLLRSAQVQAAALALEAASVAILLALVAQASGPIREWALTEATWSAAWQLELGGGPQTWPGAPELD